MNKRNIYVVGPYKTYANWMQGELVDTITKADLVVFTGGEDVSPVLYNEKSHPKTYTNHSRDVKELKEFMQAKELNKKLIGICRGSQLLCVLAGGKLVQHQENYYHEHKIHVEDGEDILITSSHHQAQYPYLLKPEEYRVLGWTKNISPIHENGNEEELELKDNKEVEIAYYPKINALAIQGHPEWMYQDKDKHTFDYLHGLLDKFMNNEI